MAADLTPKNPAASVRAPVAHRGAARASVPGGSSSAAAPAVEEDGKTSPQHRRRERAAVGTPGPDTAPPPSLLGQAAVRARVKTPAGASGHDSPPAGSKAFLDAHLAGKMTEAQLEEQIRDACKKLGILRFHVRVSIGTKAGLPDDILIGPRGILWRECKTRTGKLTGAQAAAGEALTAAGQDWGVWRPADWFSGRIQQELAALARPGAA